MLPGRLRLGPNGWVLLVLGTHGARCACHSDEAASPPPVCPAQAPSVIWVTHLTRALEERKEGEAETKAWAPNMCLAGISIHLCMTCQPGKATPSYRGNLGPRVTCLWPGGQSG